MGGMFTTLFAKLSAIIAWFGKLFVAVFKAIYDLLSDLFCFAFEGLLGLVSEALDEFDFSAFDSFANLFDQLPSELINILQLLGFSQAMTVIGVALIIRFGLQLIPLVRLGS